MDKEQIPFNYFHRMFQEELHKSLVRNMKNKIGEDDYDDELCYHFSMGIFLLSNEEKLRFYNESLWNVCVNYISLANCKMTVFPQDALEFANNILDEVEDNLYQESFLTSLQLIFQQYFEVLELGWPILKSHTDEKDDSYVKITLNSQYKIVDFDSINMDLLDQTKTMTKILMLEKNHQQGPIPKVGYHIRRDI